MGAKVATVLASLLCGLWTATQVFAYLTLLDRALGAPWWSMDLLAVYPPWRIGQWWLAWGRLTPLPFALAGGVGVVVVGLTLYRAWPRSQGKEGEAHWATRQELQKAECLPKWVWRWR